MSKKPGYVVHLFTIGDIIRILDDMVSGGRESGERIIASAIYASGLSPEWHSLTRNFKIIKGSLALMAGLLLFGRGKAIIGTIINIVRNVIALVSRGTIDGEVYFSDVIEELERLAVETGKAVGGLAAAIRALGFINQKFLDEVSFQLFLIENEVSKNGTAKNIK